MSPTLDGPGPMLPDSFLGGTAPRLRSLVLNDIPFPEVPKLLMSATHLVNLDLYGIPLSGYVPPKAMATSLSALTCLENLRLHFRYPRPRPAPESRRPSPLTRSILPRLTKIGFKGASEYLEEILAQIDAPRLIEFHITFFNQIIFDTPQLFQFISRRPTLRALENGHIVFNSKAVIVKFPSRTSDYNVLSVQISCTAPEWQLSSVEQVCTSSLPPLSALEGLYISENRGDPPRWQDDVENTLWLELLHPFAAVKNLYLCQKTVQRIAPALQDLVGVRTTEVLPILESIFLEELHSPRPHHEGIEKLCAARQLISSPLAVSLWDMDPGQPRSVTHAKRPDHPEKQPYHPEKRPEYSTKRPDYPALLNNLLQGHRTGNLSNLYEYSFSREGPNDNFTHLASAIFRGAIYGVGRGKSKGAARAAAAQMAFELFSENGVPET